MSPACIVCDGALAVALSLRTGTAVTSDCHAVSEQIRVLSCTRCGTLQKIADRAYLDAVRKIYRSYSIYRLSEGHEQVKFQDGVPRARSDIILDNVASYLPEGGRLLDIGTGSGVFLRAAHKRFGARFELYGYDVSPQARDALVAELPLKDFFTGEVSAIEGRFDLVSMIHVLEHVPRPLEVLETVRSRLLADRGVLLIQVPDIRENVFDTVIFDHVFHFTKETLAAIIGRSGLRCLTPQKQLNNETTMVAMKNGARPVSAGEAARTPVDLAPVERITDYLLASREPLAVFGVAPTGTYCGALLKEHLVCFVDEDKTIQFKQHLGKPIYPPERLDSATGVFLPPNKNSRMIMSRLVNLRFVSPGAP